jgi:hypothetical protein
MDSSKSGNTNNKKLVQKGVPASLTQSDILPARTNKQSRKRLVRGRIKGHRVKGKNYYSYARSDDKEIYLGSAEAILKAVKRGVRE